MTIAPKWFQNYFGTNKLAQKYFCPPILEPEELWLQMVQKILGPTNLGPKNVSQNAIEVGIKFGCPNMCRKFLGLSNVGLIVVANNMLILSSYNIPNCIS